MEEKRKKKPLKKRRKKEFKITNLFPKEFSKKIFCIVITLFICVLIFSMALMWKVGTTDGLAYLIPSVSGITATVIGFYFWKARVENVIKLSKEYKLNFSEVKEINDNLSSFDVGNGEGGFY